TIRPVLHDTARRDVTLIAPAEEIAREVAATLERRGVANLHDREGSYRFLCTVADQAFQAVAGRFLQLPLTEVERVDPARLEIAAWSSPAAASSTGCSGSRSSRGSSRARTGRCCSRSGRPGWSARP